MLLSKINAHLRDKKITFEETGHLYTIEGLKENPISVTTLIHKYFSKFDADKVIDKMMASSKWPTSKYYGMNKEDIKKLWENDRISAAELGTAMHKSIEFFFNQELKEHPKTKEFEFFLNFWQDFQQQNPTIKPYRTEWLVYDEEKKIAGSIDMTLENDQGELYIFDWKRSKEIKNTNQYQKGFDIFSHLDDCNFNHYSIQLNCYKYLLEKKYNKKVRGLYLVILHPNNESYLFYKALDLNDEITKLMNKLPLN